MRIGLLASVGMMLDEFFIEIVRSWEAHGHSVSLAAGTSARFKQTTEIVGLTRRPSVELVRSRTPLRNWASEAELDVIVTNSATASTVMRTVRTPVPVVYFCHGLHWNDSRTPGDRLWQAVEGSLVRRTAGVISMNSDDYDWFSTRVPPARHLQLTSGVGLNLQRYPLATLPEGPLRLTWIGEFSSRKRPHLAVETIGAMHRLGINARLEMLGEGPQRSAVIEQIQELGLDHHVSADGRGDAAAALAASHALLHTATWEGLPRVMLEALAVGRRSFAFDVKGVRDIPEACLISDGDTEALAENIARDWRSGRLVSPPLVDREVLDVEYAAEEIRNFLEQEIVPGTAQTRPHTASRFAPGAQQSPERGSLREN